MISVVVLVHNDEKQIEQTLKSISWCDEIVVIDDCSNDKTIQIAKQYKAVVFTHALGDDFAAQRNFALQKVKGDWILFVDSDEVVSETLQKEIKHAIANPQMYTAFSFKRNDFMFGRILRHGETGNVRLVRLAQKNEGVWKRRVHETWEIKGEVGDLKEPLIHYPHPDVAQFIDEINKYSTLHANALYEEGVRTNWFQIIAYPKAKFIVGFILRLGFLDGMAGFLLAIFMSFHSFLARSKLYLRQHRQP